MKIIKRSGQEVDFDKSKIINAISKANKEEQDEALRLSVGQIERIASEIEHIANNSSFIMGVEDIQDSVETLLMKEGAFNIAKKYIKYRYTRSIARKSKETDSQILSIIDNSNEEVKQENSNKNPVLISTQRDYIAGTVSKDLSERILFPLNVIKAHKEGLIHIHDMDYMVHKEHNCDLINLEDMLQNGTAISGVGIDKPKSFQTACTVTSQIVSQVASSQYGGQTFTLSHIAPFVDVSRKKIKERLSQEHKELGIDIPDEKLNQLVEKEVRKEVENGCQTIQYQLITLQTTNGQSPFVSVFMYLNEVKDEQTKKDLALIIEIMLKQRIKGIKNSKGVYIAPTFPKLIYVLQEDNLNEGDEYFYLTKLAAECTAKRMVPDYISEKVMKELKDGIVYPPMGCRSFLTVDRWSDKVGNISRRKNFKENEKMQWGRFNQGVVTINLVHVALSSGKNMERFWEILGERLELCHKALRCRHERLLGTKSDVAPILWQHGGLARLEPGETIDKLLFHGYSTISLGYIGIAEMVRYMLDTSHTSEVGKKFALEVMQKLNDVCNKWKQAENIDYSPYGTPAESLIYKVACANKRQFGTIKGVTDENFVTNSYHIHVGEEIDAFSKLSKEAEFQRLSPGGAISYVEVPNMQNNLEAVLEIMRHIYENIMYAEINCKIDNCLVCGYDGEIEIVSKDNKLIWRCPNCGNTDTTTMSIIRRTCGYLGTGENGWNQGRLSEFHERVLHL